MFYHYASVNEGRLSYRRNLQPSKDNIHHFKTWNLRRPTKINADPDPCRLHCCDCWQNMGRKLRGTKIDSHISRLSGLYFFLRWTFLAGGEEGGIRGDPDSDGRGRLATGQNILTDRRIHPSERIMISSPLWSIVWTSLCVWSTSTFCDTCIIH
jgi:hypothetical protein